MQFGQQRCDHAHLQRAQLDDCDLRGATFAMLQIDLLAHGRVVEGSQLGNAFLMNANLSNGRLDSVYAYGVHFQGALLSSATLSGASSVECDFVGARGLTLAQLSEAKTLEGSTFDRSLQDSLVKAFPSLLNIKSLQQK